MITHLNLQGAWGLSRDEPIGEIQTATWRDYQVVIIAMPDSGL